MSHYKITPLGFVDIHYDNKDISLPIELINNIADEYASGMAGHGIDERADNKDKVIIYDTSCFLIGAALMVILAGTAATLIYG